MIQRVNFLEQGRYALTYQNMAIFLSLWTALCFGVYGALLLQGVLVSTRVTMAKENAKKVREEFDKRVQFFQVSKTQEQTGTAIQSLTSIFAQLPRWSGVIADMATAAEGRVALTLVKSIAAVEGRPGKMIEIEGRGRSMEAITQFAEQLETEPTFQNVALPRSAKDSEQHDFTFTATAEVVFPPT